MNKLSRKKRRSTDVDITSLIDMMFLLLIFFMFTTSFHEETRAIEVSLPRAENPRVITLDDQVLSIAISKTNQIFLGDDEVEPAKLREELNKRLLATGFKNVLIKADSDAKYQNVVAVIDALAALEVQGLSFAVLYTAM